MLSPFRTMTRALDEFRKLDPVMPAQTMAHFLAICDRAPDEISMKELADIVGLSQASTSRNIAYLSKVWKPGTPGLDLIEAYEDPMERRRKLVRLTRKGKLVSEALRQIIGGK